MVAARQVGEIVLRLVGSLVVFYFAAFAEMGFSMALYAGVRNASGIAPLEVVAYAAAAIAILGMIFLAALPLRGAPRLAQALLILASLLMLAGFSRIFWQNKDYLGAALVVILIGIGLIALSAAWLAMHLPLRSPWRAAAAALALTVAGAAISTIATRQSIAS